MEKLYAHPYEAESAPKLGLVTNSIKEFSEKGKEHSERGMRQLFDTLVKEGYICNESIFHRKRIFGYHEAKAVAEEFAAAKVDVILIFNSAFPNGYVFPLISMNPYLRNIPMLIAADEEPNRAIGSSEWATNSVCGSDMNNYVAKYIGRYVRFLDGSPGSSSFQNELRMLLNVYHAVKMLRHDYLGRFGDAPGGFHSATGDQLLFFKTFGTTVCSVDLLRVKEVYNTMKTTGEIGKQSFSEEDIVQTQKEMADGRLNLLQDQQMLYKGARFYHALLAIIKAEGFTSAALKCWPELGDEPFKLSPCLSIAWALSKGDVTAFACESDWPGAVLQTVGRLLTGIPVAFLDFVNWSDTGDILQLGHCGVGIPCIMEPTDPALLEKVQKTKTLSKELKDKVLSGEIAVTDAIIEHGVSREAGIDLGPSLIGQFQYGIKTGFDMIQTPEGKLKLLGFTGESSSKTALKILYSGSDLHVKDYHRLFQLKREHGFSHHLAVAMGNISKELKELSAFYGIEYISPND
jgi:L-fucose isomerase-like protein